MLTPKQSIHLAAALLFRERGYPASSMRELAQRVGMEASSLYNHIRSKEELLHQICFGHATKFIEGIRTIEERSDLSPICQLEEVIRLHVRIAAEDISSVTVFNDEWRHLSEPALSEFLRMRRDYERAVQRILERGIDMGDVRPVDDPRIAVYAFLTALRWVHYWFKPGRISPERLFGNLRTLLLDGLALR